MFVKEAAKNKQAQIRIIRDFFLSFSNEIPRMNKKHAIIPETIENATARFESIFNTFNSRNLKLKEKSYSFTSNILI